MCLLLQVDKRSALLAECMERIDTLLLKQAAARDVIGRIVDARQTGAAAAGAWARGPAGGISVTGLMQGLTDQGLLSADVVQLLAELDATYSEEGGGGEPGRPLNRNCNICTNCTAPNCMNCLSGM